MSDVMTNDKLITHLNHPHPIKQIAKELQDKIVARGDLGYACVDEQLSLLEELQKFSLGRFLLVNKGLNGQWIDYIVHYPYQGRLTGLSSDQTPISALELKMLKHFPTCVATQERFQHFLTLSQPFIRDGASCASVPSGVMSDLLDLDYKDIDSIHLVGVDLDEQSLELVRKRAIQQQLSPWVTTQRVDAWLWEDENQHDLILSNGLNIYEADDLRVEQLYKKFYQALKPGGALITSLLTPPPGVDKACNWNMNDIRTDMLRLQRVIFSDIIGVSWQCYRTEIQTRAQLERAGFTSVRFVYDRAKIMPTVVALR